MRTVPAFLVIDTYGHKPTISRVRARWPELREGEVCVRVVVELPDDLVKHPVNVIEVPAENAAVAVAVEELPA